MHPTVESTWQMIRQATQGMSPEQMAEHPEGKWSSAQIVEHLLMTYTGTTGAMRKALAKGEPTGGTPTFMDHVRQFAVCNLQFIPGGRKAPKGTVPEGLDPAKVLSAVEQAIKDMDAAISECEARFGGSVRVANHPILGPLRVEHWRLFHRAHCRHHMKQIAALRGTVAARAASRGQSRP